jgi:ubiquinone/menaquinone biosynthesis C-methylase UbiE
MKSLNIGCGADTWGDVRLDVAFNFLMDAFKPTILADAHYLPFKDRSFSIVKASHVLEHLKDPLKALDEMMRVAEARIILKFPVEWGVLTVFVSNVLPIPNISSIKHAYLTRKRDCTCGFLNP